MPQADGSGLRVPFIRPEEVESRAARARADFGVAGPEIDVEFVLDVKLGLDLIVVPGMYQRTGVDALISRDWSSVYYDPRQVEPRIRFSYAHELGHFILHKELIDGLPMVHGLDEWMELYLSLPRNSIDYLETQAGMFAAAFLMAPEDVSRAFDEALTDLEGARQQAVAAGLTRSGYLEYVMGLVSGLIAPRFNVSAEAMLNRIRNLGYGDRIL